MPWLLCVAVDWIRCELSIPKLGLPDHITSSPYKVLSGNSASVAIVASITFLLPTTIELGDLTTISLS